LGVASLTKNWIIISARMSQPSRKMRLPRNRPAFTFPSRDQDDTADHAKNAPPVIQSELQVSGERLGYGNARDTDGRD
jgi:hypothetical protein